MKYKMKLRGVLSDDGSGEGESDERIIDFEARSDSVAVDRAIDKANDILVSVTMDNAYCMYFVRSLSVFRADGSLVKKVK